MNLNNEQEYKVALVEMSQLMKLYNKEDDERADELGKAIEAYESIHYPIEEPTKEEYEEYLADQCRQYDKNKIMYESQCQ